jgi:predicted O-linked N-acetylglucosamine transferase (SPINDLY family)
MAEADPLETGRQADGWVEKAAQALEEGRPQSAVEAYEQALQLQPQHAAALAGLALLHFYAGRAGVALAMLATARAAEPHSAAVAEADAELRNGGGDFEGAEALLRDLQAGSRLSKKGLFLLVEVLRKQGRTAAQVEAMEEVLARGWGDAAHEAGVLFLHNYLPEGDLSAEYARICHWSRHFPSPAQPPAFPHERDPERKLRLGYVSPDFRFHAAAHFLLPVLEHHDRARHEVICYAEYGAADLNTLQFRGCADRWVATREMNDDALEARIREDRVDVLVELAGHTAHNRLAAFARRLAPVQIHYLGYPGTTGLPAMDYRISDAVCEPPGAADAVSSERILRLPHGFHAYRPPATAPPVRPLPARRQGFITFGSFNNSLKQTPQVLALWAEILRRVPQSRLLLKSAAYGEAAIRRTFLAELARHGADLGRVRLLGENPPPSGHLDLYGQIDLALDPFPYHGTTTTCDALWMGVPVLTLAGRSHRARVGCSLLTHLGRPEWIAASAGEYVALAAEWAADWDRLAAARAGLRAAMEASPLRDERGLAAALEAAYRHAWREWLQGTDLTPG